LLVSLGSTPFFKLKSQTLTIKAAHQLLALLRWCFAAYFLAYVYGVVAVDTGHGLSLGICFNSSSIHASQDIVCPQCPHFIGPLPVMYIHVILPLFLSAQLTQGQS
jgi:hypothetical protein